MMNGVFCFCWFFFGGILCFFWKLMLCHWYYIFLFFMCGLWCFLVDVFVLMYDCINFWNLKCFKYFNSMIVLFFLLIFFVWFDDFCLSLIIFCVIDDVFMIWNVMLINVFDGFGLYVWFDWIVVVFVLICVIIFVVIFLL